MNIAIIGYGRMGHEIEKIAIAKKINVAAIIDPHEKEATHKFIDEDSLKNADVCVDFTIPNIVVSSGHGRLQPRPPDWRNLAPAAIGRARTGVRSSSAGRTSSADYRGTR